MAHDPHRYRSLFPVCRNHVYLNHAGVSAPSIRVTEAIDRWIGDVAAHGLKLESPWEPDADEVRAKAARLIGATADEIAFVRSTSHGLGLFAEGLDWQVGDELICAPSLEYPSNVYPWTRLVDRGVVVRELPTATGVAAADVEPLIGDRTRVLAVSTVQFATGYRADLGELSALCADRGVHLVVDGIQSLGAFPLDVSATPIAALSACSHKWMLGILGSGFAYIRRDLIGALRPPLVGWRSTRDRWAFDGTRFEPPDDATRFEEGTLPFGLIAGLGAAIDLLLEVGIDAIAAHVSDLLDRLVARLDALGCPSTPPAEHRAGILLFDTPPGGDIRALHQRLVTEGFAVALRRGRIRVAPHLYNTAEEIDRLGDAISAAL